MQQQISKIITIERTQLLNREKHTKSNRTSIILPYNRTLLDTKKAINKHWDILKTNRDFEEVFAEPPNIVFRQNKNLHNILGKKH